MQQLNRSTNSKMATFSFLSLLVCLSVAGLQLWHLKMFFERKKLLQFHFVLISLTFCSAVIYILLFPLYYEAELYVAQCFVPPRGQLLEKNPIKVLVCFVETGSVLFQTKGTNLSRSFVVTLNTYLHLTLNIDDFICSLTNR